MLLFYNILVTILFTLGLPYLLLMLLLRRHRLTDRLGLGAKRKLTPLRNRKTVWIHAASVGEVTAIAPFACQLRTRCPELAVVISVMTVTGLEKARQVLSEADAIILLPLDLIPVLLLWINQFRPKALLLAELELWPNLIWGARTLACRVAVVNGRLSPRGFSRYRRIKGFARAMLRHIDFFCLQSETDRDRMFQFGVLPEKTAVTGSLKFDVVPGEPAQLPLKSDRQVIVAGSTREGEEEALIEAFARLRRDFNQLLLVLAPRHLSRLPEVEALASEAGFTVARKSQMESADRDADIIVLDTMGELSSVYACAQVAFVGGSLVPVGGHNPLEPAAWGVPVLFGPYMEHQGAEDLLQQGAAFQVGGTEQLVQTMAELLRDPSRREAAGRRGKMVVSQRGGAASATVELLIQHGII